MIQRDIYGIIVQQPSMDGGDSDNRAGLMCLAGSIADSLNLHLFLTGDNRVVRHPFQSQWNDPTLTSRDQIMAYFAPAASVQSASAATYAKMWFVNKDFLDPMDRLYLYKTANVKPPFWLPLLAYPILVLSLLYNCYISPNNEMNQFVAITNRYGLFWLKLFNKLHPDLKQNISNYWAGPPTNFRDQKEIGDALNAFIQRRIT